MMRLADAANDISRRLIEAQSGLMRQTLLWAHYCRALREQGVPVDRGFLTLRQLHPQIAARSYYWDSVSGGAVEAERGYDVIAGDAYRLSPMRLVFEEQKSVHCRCDAPDEELAFPILHDLKAQGFADYLAKPLLLSGRRVQAFTLASKSKAGFSADDIALIDATTPTFAAVTELNQQRLTARSLLSIYVGQRTGERVWAGEIRRGQGDLLHAVMLFCDLRGFTELAASQPLQATIDALNAYYDAIGGAVEAAGGEILKFIGDALLAIFPAARTPEGIAASGQKALAAIREGLKRLDETNCAREAAALPPLKVGVALHVGEALYGNIGTQTRLDFTVVGTAVNTAARLGSLAGSLNEQLVISEDLASHLATPLRSLGRHRLKGLPQPIEAFAV